MRSAPAPLARATITAGSGEPAPVATHGAPASRHLSTSVRSSSRARSAKNSETPRGGLPTRSRASPATARAVSSRRRLASSSRSAAARSRCAISSRSFKVLRFAASSSASVRQAWSCSARAPHRNSKRRLPRTFSQRTILIAPTSPVRRVCVPPHAETSQSGISTIRILPLTAGGLRSAKRFTPSSSTQ